MTKLQSVHNDEIININGEHYSITEKNGIYQLQKENINRPKDRPKRFLVGDIVRRDQKSFRISLREDKEPPLCLTLILYTFREAKQAIIARLKGIYDDPQLLKLGPLNVNLRADIERILDHAIAE